MTETMIVPTTKAELLAYTEERWRAFVTSIDALSDAAWTGPTDAAGWSVKDHVAHVVLWVRTEIALLQYRTPMQQSLGISDAVWNAGWDGGDFDPINEEVRQQAIGDSPAAVRDERDRVFRKLIEVVSRFSDDDFARTATDFGLDEPGKSLLTVLTEYHGNHFDEHRGYIERIVAHD
jgi:hypothetical protein